jgi:hypothetical protein
MSKVLLLDTTKQPLYPVHPGRARLLLKEGKGRHACGAGVGTC